MSEVNVSEEVEIWKDIAGYEGYYQVSSLGRVKGLARTYYAGKTNNSLKHQAEHIKKVHINNDGYACLGFSVNGKDRKFKIHRLVATAFIDNPENKECIDHINNIRNDNRLENLRWCSRKENMENPLTVQNIKNCHIGKFQVRKRKVEQLEPTTGAVLMVHNSGLAASRHVNGCSSWIQKAAKLGKVAHGFKWRYTE